MTNSNRSYRSSQLISPFGPGSIIELGDESLIIVDPANWPKRLPEIKLDRLTKEAGVWSLKKPPVINTRSERVGAHNALQTVRFPKWMFCPRCKRMVEWTKSKGKANADGVPVCENHKCQEKILAPMRFVAACENGHLQDVPWVYWAHKNGRICEHPELYFKSDPQLGSGLDALYIECGNFKCGEKHSLKELMGPSALSGVRCNDTQPWEFKENSQRSCEAELKVLQRGASNLYYPVIRSALDIPHNPVSTGNKIYQVIKQSDDFESLLDHISKGKENLVKAYAAEIADEFEDDGFSPAEIIKAAKSEEREQRTFKIPKDEDLRVAEWEILSSEHVEEKQTNTFKARVADWSNFNTFGFDKLISRVVLLDKLREVRAFCGFDRISPSDTPVEPNSAQGNQSWLPATEVFGEGIFLQLDPQVIDRWESDMPVEIAQRIKTLKQHHGELTASYLPDPSVPFLILHTLSHLLIRQLSFESGYSSGSLRERIYTENGQAGLLIYTADGDSEGSLGGLVQQGEPERLFPMILAALETAHWCSNDPVCSEKQEQGTMGLNQAACHSCTLISETSCENNNLLLDRKILVGHEDYDGFFTQLLKQTQAEFM